MIGDTRERDETDLEASEEETLEEEMLDEDAMPDIGGETIIDLSGEIANELVEAAEESETDEAVHQREVRRRLEEIAEQRNMKLDDTFNFNLDDEV